MLAQTWAIVPAAAPPLDGEAGGRPLSLGQAVGLGLVLDLFQRAGVAEILVVLGEQDRGLCPRVLAGGGRPVTVEGTQENFFALVRAGLTALPRECQSFFVLPADLPLVRLSTLAALARVMAGGDHLATIPTHAGRWGHPPLLSQTLADVLMTWNEEGGLGAFLGALGEGLALTPVRDPGIHRSLDSPQNCRTALRRWSALRGGR